MPDARELALARLECGVVAGVAADVADVDHEVEPLAVEVVDQRLEALHFAFGVGHVAHQAEHEAARRRGGAAG